MKVKASLVVTAVGILKSIDLTKMKLSTSYKVRQILKNCEEALGDFEQRRVKLAEEYGTLNEAGDKYDFADDEAAQAFQDGMNALLDDEFDIKIKKIHVDLLDEYIDIEPTNVDLVAWFIDGLED